MPLVLRLTLLLAGAGRHPFNCEPPLPQLMEAGFITPAAIHYVRNHGAAPRLDYDTHTVTLNGALPAAARAVLQPPSARSHAAWPRRAPLEAPPHTLTQECPF